MGTAGGGQSASPDPRGACGKRRERDAAVLNQNNQAAEIVLALAQLLIVLFRHVGSGEAVTLVPVSQMLTTQQAPDILICLAMLTRNAGSERPAAPARRKFGA
jgi:hypothetical protein